MSVEDDHSQQGSACGGRFLTSPFGLGMIAIIVIGGLALWLDHRPLAGALIWLPIVLMCPLMHLFMHRHGQHRHSGD